MSLSYVLNEFERHDGVSVAIVRDTWLKPRKREIFIFIFNHKRLKKCKRLKKFNKIKKNIKHADIEKWKCW